MMENSVITDSSESEEEQFYDATEDVVHEQYGRNNTGTKLKLDEMFGQKEIASEIGLEAGDNIPQATADGERKKQGECRPTMQSYEGSDTMGHDLVQEMNLHNKDEVWVNSEERKGEAKCQEANHTAGHAPAPDINLHDDVQHLNLESNVTENVDSVDDQSSEEDTTDQVDERNDKESQELVRIQMEEQLSEEEKMERRDRSQQDKVKGNNLFKCGDYSDAISVYTDALQLCPLSFKKERSIMFSNRAACQLKLEQLEEAISDCSEAIQLNPLYMKALLRRAQTYELTEKLDEALADYQRALEVDGGCVEARIACMRLPDLIKERNEKLKEEMIGKLKDLGNMVLRPFGLSTDNFQVNQDPSTGSYSMNFCQNAGGNNGK